MRGEQHNCVNAPFTINLRTCALSAARTARHMPGFATLGAAPPESAMNKSPFYAYILLDRSGSMESCRAVTIDAFNEYVNGVAPLR